jgi:hypothetical protein
MSFVWDTVKQESSGKLYFPVHKEDNNDRNISFKNLKFQDSIYGL